MIWVVGLFVYFPLTILSMIWLGFIESFGPAVSAIARLEAQIDPNSHIAIEPGLAWLFWPLIATELVRALLAYRRNVRFFSVIAGYYVSLTFGLIGALAGYNLGLPSMLVAVATAFSLYVGEMSYRSMRGVLKILRNSPAPDYPS